MKKHVLISALITAAVLLAGCGGGNNSQTTTAAPEAPAVTEQISVEDAKAIAFEDAGANEIDVVLKKAALDTDEGVLEYEVEFFFNDTEYSYDIDPDTGDILDFEAERDD